MEASFQSGHRLSSVSGKPEYLWQGRLLQKEEGLQLLFLMDLQQQNSLRWQNEPELYGIL
jgi:hypothetical protein